ncbi:hypothetical protein J437_LFUL016782 [Ladona fulva]|uniref:Uncharacterized protein n=1 Tax=Ladona fulva TaxID=123851 RepID=A0A8K0KMY0_LADFU|nr:hypothetical protein J437_LFUL016782 [Ladona fulva]
MRNLYMSRSTSWELCYLPDHGVHKFTPQGSKLRVVLDASFVLRTRDPKCQILITPVHRGLQHILWRDDSARALQEFELNTVTYGVVTSPYLAIRTLNQQLNDEGETFPLGA